MKREFITTDGKVIIEDNILHVKKLIHRPASTSWFFVVVMIMYTITRFADDTKGKPLLIMLIILLGIFFIMSVYEVFFMLAWKKKIALQEIKSYKIYKDNHGIETEVILFLNSGRQKKITFRVHENQLEPFLEMATQYLTHPQIAN